MTEASRRYRTLALIAVHFTLRIIRLLRARLVAMAVPLLTAGHTALIGRRFPAVRRRGMERSGSRAMQSNRMPGQAFQNPGQPDIAFDEFHPVPVNDGAMSPLQKPGVDFERKRRFNRVEPASRCMPEFSLKFRDIERHLGHALSMADTVVLDAHGACPGGAAIPLGNGAGTPVLGRYQIGRKLGKGATGDVYLGKDRETGQVVAVKILALPQKSGCDELKSAKERFFREAETAGRLNHPGIVTIFDAGEERDLAYVAMEFLKGRDLKSYAGPGNLLPLPRVLSIAARVAEALDYAHGRGIVHRDVKPANIMYEADSDTVKVTDFGIAGITDSSRAVGGTVLGTPCYMSPEQLSEGKVEGRSDLFSLGVTLYQLSCGHLPFRSSSMAQLMLKIANEPHTDILDYNPALLGCVVDVVNKTLAKQPERRYQTGNEMALALRACLAGAAPSKSGPVAVNF